MYDKVQPLTDEFEHLKQFCFLIGEGRLEPKMDEMHYFHLYHPTVPEAFLIVHWDAGTRNFYIREPIEGFIYDIDELPLVHEFPLGRRKRNIFPSKVSITEDEKHVLYYYEYGSGPEAHIIETVTMRQYLRLKMLFDEKNPIPWEEEK